MSLRCLYCDAVYPAHGPVCWVPGARVRQLRRERARRLWGLVEWAAAGVALGLLLVATLEVLGTAS